MGLDNMPLNYPCKTQGTAVLVDEQIDCRATQEKGGCPWQNANPPKNGRIYGMLGTDCWYRGKVGNYLLEKVTEEDKMGDNLDFYGDNADGTEKSAESCIQVADLIATAMMTYEKNQEKLDDEAKELAEDLRYAEWYLRWAAKECGGLYCWY